MKKIVRFIQNPYKLFSFLATKGFFKRMSDEKYIKYMFRSQLGYKLDLKNPRTYNEKLQWLKLNDRKPIYTIMVDKYEVRKFVKEKIGEEYLIPLLGVWDNFEDINFNKLPHSFVLKTTADSGGVFICKDIETFDFDDKKRKIKKKLKQNYYYLHREWAYKNLKPRIIAEQYITDGFDISKKSNNDNDLTLTDYKFMCFDGEPLFCMVHSQRFLNHKQTIYDINWKRVNRFNQMKEYGAGPADYEIKKPQKLNELIELTRVLAAGIKHVRVDWYISNNKIYFGELTFFDGAGFTPFDDFADDLYLGSKINL